MNRTARISLSVAAVSAAALVPLGAYAVGGGSGSASCSSQQNAVTAAQSTVSHDQAVLAAAEKKKAKKHKAKAKKQKAVAKATKRLLRDEARLNVVQAALIACQKAQPAPTVTATVTASSAPSSYTPPALSWKSGTALLKETMPDGSPIAPLGYWDGVPIAGTGFGSAWTADPAHPGYYYGLTDRGPNVTAPDGSDKLEPLDGFQDSIGYFHVVGGTLQLVKTIGLTLPNGEPLGGLENTEADAGETILNQYGQTLPHSATGLDTEGIAVMPDGTFWISDEYGPFIVHFDASGKEIERFDPYITTSLSAADDTTFGDKEYPLPAELKRRKPNKGMEGLTVTPDGKYLVGIMQSPLDKNAGTGGGSGTKAASGAIVRIVKIDISDLANLKPSDISEYLYALHTNGAGNPEGQAVSEITALDDTHFVVDERDGNFESAKADKNLWKVDLTNATNVGPSATGYDATSGLNVGGQSIEDIAGTLDGPAAVAALEAKGIKVGAESLFLNYAGLVQQIDPTGAYFEHDKVEGVSIDPADPNIVYLSNDSDFGITDLPAGDDPTADKRAKGTDAYKKLPAAGVQDFGEVMEVDLSKVPAQFK